MGGDTVSPSVKAVDSVTVSPPDVPVMPSISPTGRSVELPDVAPEMVPLAPPETMFSAVEPVSSRGQ